MKSQIEDLIRHVEYTEENFNVVPPLVSDVPLSYRTNDSDHKQKINTQDSLRSVKFHNLSNHDCEEIILVKSLTPEENSENKLFEQKISPQTSISRYVFLVKTLKTPFLSNFRSTVVLLSGHCK